MNAPAHVFFPFQYSIPGGSRPDDIPIAVFNEQTLVCHFIDKGTEFFFKSCKRRCLIVEFIYGCFNLRPKVFFTSL